MGTVYTRRSMIQWMSIRTNRVKNKKNGAMSNDITGMRKDRIVIAPPMLIYKVRIINLKKKKRLGELLVQQLKCTNVMCDNRRDALMLCLWILNMVMNYYTYQVTKNGECMQLFVESGPCYFYLLLHRLSWNARHWRPLFSLSTFQSRHSCLFIAFDKKLRFLRDE